MGHLTEGRLRAFRDGALSEAESVQVREHLDACAQCAHLAVFVEGRAVSVHNLLSEAAPPTAYKPVSPQVARRQFDAYVEHKKERKMRSNPFSKRYRPAWGIVALVIVIGLTFTFPPVRTLASNFLALFRVQKIAFVEFNPLNLPDNQTVQSAAMEIERLVSEEVVVESDGEPQTVDAATARSMVAFPVRFPSAVESLPQAGLYQIDVQPAIQMAMQIDLDRVQLLLDTLGYSNVSLPDSLDGADVSVDIAQSVTASYGACTSKAKGDCALLIQMPSPNVSAPPELDVQQLGQLYLRMLGMSEGEAARFSRNVDWTTTLVVPVPSTEAKYEDVRVDGVTGTFVQARDPDKGPEYVLMWVKDGTVYALIGTGDKASALEIAGSLE